MKRKHRNRTRRKLCILLSITGFLPCLCVTMKISASTISADSDISKITYKYYTSYYVEAGDTLWSIAKDNMTEEYPDVNSYIHEIKRINHIHGDLVPQGSYLSIPYYSMEHK